MLVIRKFFEYRFISFLGVVINPPQIGQFKYLLNVIVHHLLLYLYLPTLSKLYLLESYNKPYSKDKIENLDNEEWKEIDDTDHLYYISNKGRIKSLQAYEAVILKPYNNQSGYARVDIRVSGRRQTKLVHRLVAAAFLPMP